MLIYPVNVRQTAATNAGAIVWGLYNPSATKVVVVKAMQLQMYFDGTAAATLMKYEMVKYTGVTAFSAGAPAPPMYRRTAQSSSIVGLARVLDTGLTATNGVAQNAVQLGAMGRVTQTTTNFQAVWSLPMNYVLDNLRAQTIELAQNELLAIRQSVQSVIGDNLVGYVESEEVAA